jgi:hypothetical protein
MKQGPKSRRFGAAIVTMMCAFALLGAAAAQASTISIGSVLPTTFKSVPFGQTETQFNTALPEKGANLTSPVTGAVVRWRIQGAKGGPFFLRVLRPTGSGAYTAVGTSAAATPTNAGLQTFTTNLPIHSGDLIAIDSSNPSDEIGMAEVAGANTAFIFPPPFEGATVAPSGSASGQELELSAEVQPAPAISEIAPLRGSITGGTKVVITGENLTGASAVKFGEVAAASFTVDSDTQITAVAPKGTSVGVVPLSVTTLAGTGSTSRGGGFEYTACTVPALVGLKQSVAKQRLQRHGCKSGVVSRVKGPRAKVGKVISQTPKAGKVLAPGSRVNLKVGR